MKTKDIIGILFVIIAACLAGGGLYAAQYFKKPKFDSMSLCPLSGVTAATVIIIDKTDPLRANELQRLREIIERERKALEPGAKIIISMLEQVPGTAKVSSHPVLSLCNPGSEANPLYQNPKRVTARYNESFLRPLESAIQKIPGEGSAPTSPIAEAVDLAMAGESMAPVEKGKLVLVSDLMEHTLEGSAYDGTFTARTLHKIIPPEVSMRLRKFAIEIVLLPRPAYENRQNAAKAVWRDYFAAVSGGAPVLTTP